MSFQKRPKGSIRLHRETLRKLVGDEMDQVVAGSGRTAIDYRTCGCTVGNTCDTRCVPCEEPC